VYLDGNFPIERPPKYFKHIQTLIQLYYFEKKNEFFFSNIPKELLTFKILPFDDHRANSHNRCPIYFGENIKKN